MGDTANPVLDREDVDLVKVGMRLEARLVAYEIAIARPERVIPRSLADFLERAVSGQDTGS